ncbi:Periplasmic dipeptide transport protein precursor (Dipeptide-binding protein) (DBP) [Candidatus Glomeribacter gigasporarum BEG34]|uniref:Periplasmic dipeptide transport protein (Dipeptide-binding protein) (DBP) n=1 Tax=Candidatus Glomeribacter gigasporarum BEG34 TaxID=1070319 RepID=G2J9W5_9BURK|nr:ABC transporter substrate-binding protein [Candidatus Glomeribacter gigasporarum]CCD29562.1 Periplasmic dipeptide transport protein precursor (Dipeptide-binding protein) (DBP) [Candidatus Glomeribacter gigasporarum BEG34]
MQIKQSLFYKALVLFGIPLTVSAQSLTVCTEGSPDGFDVVQYNSLITTNASADLIFNGLVALDESTGAVIPALARRWEVSDDGLSYTFYLRPGVQFQTTPYFKPSRALNADDVAFSFNRMLNPDHPWHRVPAGGGFPHAQAMQLPQRIKSIDKLDGMTVRFSLNEPAATFLPILTMGFVSIYSKEYADQLFKDKRTADMNTKPVGTGPFMLRGYQKDALIRYDANPHYWDGRPKVERLLYAITPDAAVRMQKLKAGECQIVLSPRPQDVFAVKQGKVSKEIKAVETPAFMTAFVALNTQRIPLDNPKVRQALNLAFDRETYLKAVFYGTASPAYHPYPPSTWSYAKGIRPWPYDPEQAAKLLIEAGYPKGFETAIWTRPSGSALNPNPKVGAELLQSDLAKIGVRAKVKIVEWGELIRRAKQGEHALLFMGWSGDNGDPDNFMTPQFSCAAVRAGVNFARFCDPKLDQLIQEARTSSDRAQRTQAYLDAQQIIHEQALWIPLGHPNAAALIRGTVSGYRVSPYGRQNFATVLIR